MAKKPAKRGPGRPKGENSRRAILHVRVTREELDTMKLNARASDQALSEFVREKALATS